MTRMLLQLSLCFILLQACNPQQKDGPEIPSTPEVKATVERYTYPSDWRKSQHFIASVDGKQAFVYETPEPDVLSFGCDTTVRIAVKPIGRTVTTADVRPHAKGYKCTVENGMVILYLKPYDRASVEINGDISKPLFIFVNPLETKPSASENNVTVLKAGTITQDPITLSGKSTLYLEGGAVLMGGVICKEKADVKVMGPGVIDGIEDTETTRRTVLFENCRNIVFNDVTVLNKTSWTVNMFQCENIEVDNMKMIAINSENGYAAGHQNDGFSIIGSDHMKVTRGFSYSHDDTYSIKTQKWVYSGVVTDVLYEDLVCWNELGGHALELGTGLGKELSGVVWRNCYSIHSGGVANPGVGSDIGILNAAAGTVHDILYENIYIEQPRSRPLYFRIYNAGEDENIGTGITWSTPGHIKSITLRNVSIDKMPANKLYIKGYDADHTVNVTFENLVIEGKPITAANMSQYFDAKFANISFVK